MTALLLPGAAWHHDGADRGEARISQSKVDELLEGLRDTTIPPSDAQILIVEDEETMGLALESLLLGEGFPVLTVVTGEAGLQAMQTVEPRVVLVDKNLPDISGLRVIERGRAIVPDAEFIVMTGFQSVESALEAIDLGAFGYLVKPFPDIMDVAKRVHAALRSHNQTYRTKLLVERLRSAYEKLVSANEVAVVDTLAAVDDVVFDLVAALARIQRAGADLSEYTKELAARTGLTERSAQRFRRFAEALDHAERVKARGLSLIESHASAGSDEDEF